MVDLSVVNVVDFSSYLFTKSNLIPSQDVHLEVPVSIKPDKQGH